MKKRKKVKTGNGRVFSSHSTKCRLETHGRDIIADDHIEMSDIKVKHCGVFGEL